MQRGLTEPYCNLGACCYYHTQRGSTPLINLYVPGTVEAAKREWMHTTSGGAGANPSKAVVTALLGSPIIFSNSAAFLGTWFQDLDIIHRWLISPRSGILKTTTQSSHTQLTAVGLDSHGTLRERSRTRVVEVVGRTGFLCGGKGATQEVRRKRRGKGDDKPGTPKSHHRCRKQGAAETLKGWLQQW